jgi:cell division protein FtsQ
MLALTTSLAILIQQNIQSVAQFINRPITKVLTYNQWQQISESEVREMLIRHMGSGFFNFDVEGVKRELELHPWIENAWVKKEWPDSLSLQLTEQVAIAHWGQSQLLNQKGNVFQPPGAKLLTALPLLNGPEQSQDRVMEQYQVMSQVLFPSGLRLSGLSLSPRGSWELEINGEMQVAVGRTDVIEKLARFIAFYDAQPSALSASFKTIDLRYDNGIAIKSENDSAHEDFAGVAVR